MKAKYEITIPLEITLPDGRRISLNHASLEKEFLDLSSRLHGIGLSTYEANVYIALVVHGYGDVETIAKTSKVPRTSTYKTLHSLVDKGFAIEIEGKPKIFKPEAPSIVCDRRIQEMNDIFGRLNLLHNIGEEKGDPQIIYTIHGKAKVLKKIGQVMDTCTTTFIISTSTFKEIFLVLEKQIRNMINRGVEMTVITTPFQKVPDGITVVRKNRVGATDLVCDHEKAILASMDLNVCGYTDNSSLAIHFERFLYMVLEQ